MLLKATIGILLLLAFYIGDLLWDAGVFLRIEPLHTVGCHRLYDFKGAEDIARLNDGTLLLSTYDRHSYNNGAIVWLDREGKAYSLTMPSSIGDFRPHGIDVWQENNETLVYVINHSQLGDRLDIFEVDFVSKKLTQNNMLSRLLPSNANDISLISRDQWFISFDHLGRKRWQQKLEQYLRLPLSYVALVSPKDFTAISKGHRFANGVYYDKDKSLLYVASMLDRNLTVYRYDNFNQDLTLLKTITNLGGVDNIMFDSQRHSLWVASHPNLLQLSAASQSSANKSPSRIWEITLDANGIPLQPLPQFVDRGDMFSSSSVALPVGTDFYIGSVFDRGLLRCPVVLTEVK